MRRRHDAYYTPPWQTRALLAHQSIRGVVLEPCVGDGSIARVLRHEAGLSVVTNDLDPACSAEFHRDAADEPLYDALRQGVDWVITNPPYAMPTCLDIVSRAVGHARCGVAMLLRISFREPTNGRGPWLAAHPPDRALTLPRHSYTGNGKSDSATTEWVIWCTDAALRVSSGPPLRSLYDADVQYASALDGDAFAVSHAVAPCRNEAAQQLVALRGGNAHGD